MIIIKQLSWLLAGIVCIFIIGTSCDLFSLSQHIFYQKKTISTLNTQIEEEKEKIHSNNQLENKINILFKEKSTLCSESNLSLMVIDIIHLIQSNHLMLDSIVPMQDKSSLSNYKMTIVMKGTFQQLEFLFYQFYLYDIPIFIDDYSFQKESTEKWNLVLHAKLLLNINDSRVKKICNVNRQTNLTTFPLRFYHFLGLIENPNQQWGIVSLPNKKIYLVSIHNLIGQEQANVMNINDKGLKLEICNNHVKEKA